MNTVKYVLAVISYFVLAACVGVVLRDFQTPNISPEKQQAQAFLLFLFLLATGTAFVIAEIYRKNVKWLPQPEQKPDLRPIVRVWTNNGITGVVAEYDWRLHQDFKERKLLVGIQAYLPGCHSQMPLTAFFASPERKMDPNFYWVGNNKDLDAILSKCMVKKTKMFIPDNLTPRDMIEHGFAAIDLKTAYRLIFDADIEPLAN